MTRSKLIERIKAGPYSPLEKALIVGSIISAWPTDPIMPTMTHALKMCCLAAGAAEGDVRGDSQKRSVVRARHLFFWWTDKKYTRVDVGAFCNRDHTSVFHGVESIKNLIHIKDPLTMADISMLETLLDMVDVDGNGNPRTKRIKDVVKIILDKKDRVYYKTANDLYSALGVNPASYKKLQIKHPGRFYKIGVPRRKAEVLINKNKFVASD